MVFIDGDHSEAGCELDWSAWHPFVAPGGRVVFHDARAGPAGWPRAARADGGRAAPFPLAGADAGLGDRGRGRSHGGRAAGGLTRLRSAAREARRRLVSLYAGSFASERHR